MDQRKAAPLLPLLLIVLFTASRFLLGRWFPDEPVHGTAALLLDGLWCIPMFFRFRRNRASLMPGKNAKLPVSFALALLSFGILQLLRTALSPDAPLQPVPAFLVMLDLVLISPLLEEWVFRAEGYLTLKSGMPAWCALFISSLLFAAGHLDTGSPIAAFVFGILAILLLETSSSLLFPILLHVLLNAVSFLPPMPLWGSAVITLSGLVLTGLLWKQEQRQAP